MRKQIKRDYEGRIQEFYKSVDDEKEKLHGERKFLLEQLKLVERKRAELEQKAKGGPDAKADLHVQERRCCPVYQAAERALKTLDLDSRLLDRLHDRCFCPECYPSNSPDLIPNDGPTDYVIPRGFVGFGLQIPAWAQVKDVFRKWCVSYHGLKIEVAPIVIRQGELLFPGDKLPDGKVLESSNCAGRQDKCIYTSPTINYSGLAFYANPGTSSDGRKFQVVLQCRQEPGTFDIQRETMGFRNRWGTTDLCPHVKWTEIEWTTDRRKTVVPARLLVRTFPADSPPAQHYRSPVDGGRFK
jgi:hypothetical protein